MRTSFKSGNCFAFIGHVSANILCWNSWILALVRAVNTNKSKHGKRKK